MSELYFSTFITHLQAPAVTICTMGCINAPGNYAGTDVNKAIKEAIENSTGPFIDINYPLFIKLHLSAGYYSDYHGSRYMVSTEINTALAGVMVRYIDDVGFKLARYSDSDGWYWNRQDRGEFIPAYDRAWKTYCEFDTKNWRKELRPEDFEVTES